MKAYSLRRVAVRLSGWAIAGAIACAGGLATAQAQPAPGAESTAACKTPDEIRVMIFASVFNQMVTYIAKDAGFFAENCLDVSLVPVNTGPAGMAELQGGSLQFSDSSFDNTLIARNRGLPIKVVVGESSSVPYSIVVRKGLATPHAKEGYPAVMKDLVGKKVGVFGLGTGSQYFVRALLRGANLDPSSVTYISVGSTPTQLAALEHGAVDAVIMADPAQDIAVARGAGRIVVDLRKPDVGPATVRNLGGIFQVKVASEAFIKGHPGVMKRYIRANEEAASWIHDPANISKLLAYMKKRVGLGEDVPNAHKIFADLVEKYAGFSTAKISRKSVAAWNQFEIDAGNLTKPVPYDSVIWSGAPTGK